MTTTTTIDQWWTQRQHDDAVHWTRLSAEATDHIHRTIGRDDLIVTMEPGSGHGAPAVYIAGTADIEVDPDTCLPGINPADIDLTTEVGQLRHPQLVGALDHEGGHGQFSQWPIDQSPAMRRLMQTALLLEEPLMERDIIDARPHRRVYLRASFHQIVDRGGNAPDTPAAAAHLAALTHGRVDAGVLTAEEAAPVIDQCRTILGTDRYDQLRQVWLDGMALPVPRTDADAMTALAQRWLDILGDDDSDGGGDPDRYICGHSRSTDSTDGTDSSDGGDPLTATADRVAATAADEAADAKDAAQTREAAARRTADAKDAADAAATAATVFSRRTSSSSGSGGHAREGLGPARQPRPDEVAQANQLAARLRKAQHRERTTTTTTSATPPGRLRTSAAVRRSAERSMGIMSNVEPWRATRRKHVDSPPITAAVACDISGSMRWATEAVASAAWIIARAVHRNDGDTATVAYGNDVHPVVKPGERPAQVRTFDANAGTENWTDAIRALDGALHLRNGSGARILVIISDGHYTHRQRSDGDRMVDALLRAGVKVLWIGFRGTDHDNPHPGADYVRATDPAQMGAVIGAAMVKILERT